MSKIIENVCLDTGITLEMDSIELADERYRQLYETIFGISYLLEGLTYTGDGDTSRQALEMRLALEMRVSEDELKADLSDYIDELMEALDCGRQVTTREDSADIARDFSRINESSLRELRETLVPVARHLGTELNLPDDTEVSEIESGVVHDTQKQ